MGYPGICATACCTNRGLNERVWADPTQINPMANRCNVCPHFETIQTWATTAKEVGIQTRAVVNMDGYIRLHGLILSTVHK
jgi:hypothetical protein